MQVRIRKGRFGILTILACSLLISVWGYGNFGVPPTNGHLSITSGTLFPQTTGGLYNTAYGFSSNSTFWFSVVGLEVSEPSLSNGKGVSFLITTTSQTTVTFATGLTPIVTCLCTVTLTGSTLKMVFAPGLTLSSFMIVWTPAPIPTEAQAVLFRDDFLYTNPLIESSWTVDTYQSPQTNPGEYTSSGYLNMKAQSTSSVETVHVTTPAFVPSTYAGQNIIVKRKLTVTAIPFKAQDLSGTANLRVGFTPLLSTGTYPGNLPANTPNIDFTNNCASSPALPDNVGSEFLNIGNDGGVNAIACGDPSGTRTITKLEAVDPTQYTVLTVETYGQFCSTCTDNVHPGIAWVWFRIYQENTAGQIIAGTDKNINYTSNIAPYFQTNFVFISQTNSNGAATGQFSKIDMVQLQNYGSPVCLVAPAGALCTRLPQVPNNIIGGNGLVGLMAWLANQLGFGDEQAGAILLFLIVSCAGGFMPFFFTRNVTVGIFGELNVIGFFVFSGFLPIWTIILIFIGDSALVVMMAMRFLEGRSMMGAGGAE